VGLREESFKSRHLRIRQPEKIAHVTAPLSEQGFRSSPEYQWVLTLGPFSFFEEHLHLSGVFRF
jgi:hypothetical protein